MHNKTSILHLPWQRNQLSRKRLPHLSQDQKEDGARFGTTFAPTRTPRSQPRLHITKILIDNGSQAEILFLATFDKIGFE
jgi:hypothetical protein